MRKYKKALVVKIQENKEYEKKQSDLKQKHGLEKSENVIIVEKNNMIKFLIRTGAALFRIVAQFIILSLAAIGLITLIYPEIRISFWSVMLSLKEELISFM